MVFSWYVALEEEASMMASVLGRGLHVDDVLWVTFS